jgi:hypothetical protein
LHVEKHWLHQIRLGHEEWSDFFLITYSGHERKRSEDELNTFGQVREAVFSSPLTVFFRTLARYMEAG